MSRRGWAVHKTYPRFSKREMMGPTRPRCKHSQYVKDEQRNTNGALTYLNTVRLDGNEAIPTISAAPLLRYIVELSTHVCSLDMFACSFSCSWIVRLTVIR